ncbi:hypothetical protein [Nocardia sp. NPDC060249]|uniref:hypothetical protein n=1 Tax=Nocardia sp. NPDC060249 TaxID=3347082 RepID=UPI003649FABA
MESKRNPWWAAVLIGAFVVFLAMSDGGSFTGAVILLLVVGVPLAFIVLVVRALYRLGEPRPAPVAFVAPPASQASRSAPNSGWYNNPDGDGERWWDGLDWTRRPK